MEELLTGLYENTNIPVLSAFLLGLLTAISPCPMATNITAIGFIGKDLEVKNRVFYNGLIYTLGRALSYSILAILLYVGADQFKLSSFFQLYGEKILGPLLIVVGIFMLGIIKINFPGLNLFSQKLEKKNRWNFWNVLLLGVVFALAFCPYSGVLYFGMLIPMSIGSAKGLLLPVVYAVATGIPVIIIAWLLAFTISGVSKFYNILKKVFIMLLLFGFLENDVSNWLSFRRRRRRNLITICRFLIRTSLEMTIKLSLALKMKNYLYILLLPVWIAIYMNLSTITDFFVYDLFQLEEGKHLTESIWFFIYEVPKVMLLLVLIVFFVGVVRSWFSPEKTRKALEGKSLFAGNVMASGLGILTPFCSCSAIPLFLGFVEAGIPLGVTFSFLIAAPLINEVALILLAGLFGWKVALIYVFTGLTIAIVSGFVLEKLKLQRYVAEWVFTVKSNQPELAEEKLTFNSRMNAGLDSVKEIVGKIWIYILIGIAVGAGAHGFVPEDYLVRIMGEGNWYAVPLAILLGIPLYSNAAGIIPIVSVLMEKGVTLGTALAFMMSVIGLSLPEIIILKKVLKWQLIVIFIVVVATGITLVGFLFNIINL